MNVVSIRRSDEPMRERSDEPEHEDQGEQLKRIYAMFLRRWRLALAAALVVFAAVAAYTLLSPRIYTATALLMVNPGREQVIAQEQMIENAAPSSAAVDSEIEVLRSRMLSARLVDEMNLVEDPEWNSSLRPPGLLATVLSPLSALSANNVDQERNTEAQRDGIARAVNEAITVRRRGLSYGIEVSLDSRDPRRAAQLTNKYTELYLLSQTEARFEASQRANDWLTTRLSELRIEVQTKERAAEAFRLENGLSVAAGGEANMPPQSEEVQTMLVQSRADLAEKEARLRQVQRLIGAGGTAESIGTALNSQVITDLRNREAELAQRGGELRRRYSEEHPQVLAAQAELAGVRQRIDDEIRRITAGLQNDVDIARARLGTLQGSFGGAAGARDQDNEAVIRYRELLRDAGAARSVHESFLQRFHEVSDQGNLPTATSRIVSPAMTPTGPSRPNVSSSLLLALLLAGLAGAGLAFLLETLDSSLSNAEDAERKLGVPAVASVPVLKVRDLQGQPPHRREPALYLVDKPASAFAEAFRVLRTSLMHATIDRRPQIVAITSAVPDEGKTTTALCLARISAMSGQRVLLVDCDLRRHSLSEELGVHPAHGLLDVLSGDVSWRDVLVQDPESSAHAIPTLAGRFTPRGVFESEAMARFIQDVRTQYDVIVLDSAPVLAVAETRTVAAHADVTLLVVRSDKTPAGAARTALREVMHAGANVAGVALNYVDPRRPGHGSYGDTLYYSYGRKYYSS